MHMLRYAIPFEMHFDANNTTKIHVYLDGSSNSIDQAWTKLNFIEEDLERCTVHRSEIAEKLNDVKNKTKHIVDVSIIRVYRVSR